MTRILKERGNNMRLVCLIGTGILMSPAFCWAQGPAIKSGGVVSASAFGQFTSIAPSSWIEIYGTNLATNTRGWAGADFKGANAPTSLDGTSVTIGGQPAFIDYISPGQVNAQVPSAIGPGSQPVVVTVGAVSSAPYAVNVNAVQPGLLAPSSFNIGGKQYAGALFPDGVTYVLPPGAIAGVNSRRAQPGDTITVYGIGFGPVTPNIPAGQVVQQSNTLAASLQVQFGGNPAMLNYNGLAPSAVGLYQFNVVVPSVPASDAVPLTFTLGGVAGTQTLYIPAGTPLAQIQSVSLSPSTVTGGGTVQGTVTLSAAAPAGGAVVALSSNSSAASVPATVPVPAGAISAAFTVSTSSVSASQTAAISAAYGGGSAQASLTVTPATGGPPLTSFITLILPGSSEIGAGALMVNCIAGNCSGTVSGNSVGSVVNYVAVWTTVVRNGNTVTFGGFQGANSRMQNNTAATVAPITSASLTLTLSPATNSLTGTMTLVSTLATISGSFTANYGGQ